MDECLPRVCVIRHDPKSGIGHSTRRIPAKIEAVYVALEANRRVTIIISKGLLNTDNDSIRTIIIEVYGGKEAGKTCTRALIHVHRQPTSDTKNALSLIRIFFEIRVKRSKRIPWENCHRRRTTAV